MFLQLLQNFKNDICKLLVLLCSICCTPIQFHGSCAIRRGERAVNWWKFHGCRLLTMASKSNLESSSIRLWWTYCRRANRPYWSCSVTRNWGRGLESCLWLSSSSFVTWLVLECFLWWWCALFSPRHWRSRQRTRAYHCWKHRMERPYQLFSHQWQASSEGMVYWETYKIKISTNTKVLWQSIYCLTTCKEWDSYRHSFHRFHNKLYQYCRKNHSSHRVGHTDTWSKIKSSYSSQDV